MDVSPEIAIERISTTRGDIPNHFEKVDSLRLVRQIFLDLAASDDVIRLLDASRAIGEIYGTIGRLLVDGVLKAKRCAKSYDCDVFYCTERILGNCRWANLYPHLIQTRPNGSLPALLK